MSYSADGIVILQSNRHPHLPPAPPKNVVFIFVFIHDIVPMSIACVSGKASNFFCITGLGDIYSLVS